jgi:predicted metal-binding membrane protein
LDTTGTTPADGTTATSPPSPGRPEALDRFLARPDLQILSGVGALAALAWWDLLRHGDMMCGVPTQPWHWPDLGMAAVMWSVMMVAMMLPSAAPMTMLFARVQRHRRAEGQAATPVTLFLAGYLLAWTAWSVLAASLQWALQSTLLMSHHLALDSMTLAGAFVVVAGVYQLTPLKNVCLAHCQSPIGFFVSKWREGWAGALGMGARHGAYCIGCCWALMGLLFVVGVMNVAWVAGLSGYVFLEKIVPRLAASRIVGVALVGWGIWLMH